MMSCLLESHSLSRSGSHFIMSQHCLTCDQCSWVAPPQGHIWPCLLGSLGVKKNKILLDWIFEEITDANQTTGFTSYEMSDSRHNHFPFFMFLIFFLIQSWLHYIIMFSEKYTYSQFTYTRLVEGLCVSIYINMATLKGWDWLNTVSSGVLIQISSYYSLSVTPHTSHRTTCHLLSLIFHFSWP